MQNDVIWQYLSEDETVRTFSTNAERGLNTSAVSYRRGKFGPNDLWDTEKVSFRRVAVKYLLDGATVFLLIDLLCAAFAGFDWQFALILIMSVLFVALRVACDVILGRVAEDGARSAIPETLVIRDGKTELIPAYDLVIGDVVLLSEGDIVPADLRVINADSLVVSEKDVTANDIPVEKISSALPRRPANEEPENMSNMLFAFSYVLRGTARCVCAASGARTLAASKGKKQTLRAATVGEAQKRSERVAAVSASVLMIAAMIYIFVGLFAFKGKFTVTGVFLTAFSFAVAGFGTVWHSLVLFSHTRRMTRLYRLGGDVRSPDAPDAASECGAFLIRDVSDLTSGGVEVCSAVTLGRSFEGNSLFEKNAALSELFKMLALASGFSSAPISAGTALLVDRDCKSAIETYLNKTGLKAAELTRGAALAALRPKGDGEVFDTAVWIEDGRYHAACVGEISRVLSVCRTVAGEGYEELLDERERERYISLAKEAEDKGCRVIAISHRIPPTHDFSRIAVIQNQMEFVGFVAVRPVPSDFAAKTVEAFSSPERSVVCFAASHSEAVFALEDKMIKGAALAEVKAPATSLRFEKGKNYVVCVPEDVLSAEMRVRIMLSLARRLKNEVGGVAFVGRSLADGVFAREAKVRLCVRSDKRLSPAPYSLTASADAIFHAKEDAAVCEGVSEMIRSTDREKRFALLWKYLIGSQIARAVLFAVSLFLPPVIPAVAFLVWGLALDMAAGAFILNSKRVGRLLAKPKGAHDKRQKMKNPENV